MPADDGLGFHEEHSVHEAVEAARQRTDEPAIESAQARAFDLAADDDELLAEDQVLGDQGCAGRDEGQDEVEHEAKEADHGSDRVPRWTFSGAAGVRPGAGWSGGGRTELAATTSRHRRGHQSRSSSLRNICAPQASMRRHITPRSVAQV